VSTEATRTIELHGKGVCSLAWLPSPTVNGEQLWLACGMGDNTIILCDAETGKEVTTMHGHSGTVHALLWLEAKGWLVSGSSDATLRTWRVRSGARITSSAWRKAKLRYGKAQGQQEDLEQAQSSDSVGPDAATAREARLEALMAQK
jgi:WD40 repeat protein